MNRYLFIIIILYFIPVKSQNYLQRFDGIPVTVGGQLTSSPFNGGIDIPRYQLVDIDGDSDLDIFLYDRDTSLNFYRNDGNTSIYNFKLINLKYQNLNISSWFYFVDIDSDNDNDLFTGSVNQTIKFYRNTGNSVTPSFSLQIDPLKTDLDSVVISEAICNPTFADINADGDLDFFSGNSVGTVTYYENIGTPQNFIFKFRTGQFANIQIIGGGYYRHGASSITFHDIDADNDKDLFWGDFFHYSIYLIKNTGTPQNFTWNFIDSTFPEPNTLITQGYNMTQFYDMDNDGDKDLLNGVLYGSQIKDNFYYYKNNGPPNAPQFIMQTANLILNTDAGSNSFPVFTDIDNDNDFDLFVGAGSAKIQFYRNVGNPILPNLIMVTDSLPIISAGFNYAPAFGDLDGDNKKDMVVGQFSFGRLKYYKNTGTLTEPVFTSQSSQFDNIQVGQSSAPALTDIDNDGDLDLFIGNSAGKAFFYRNIGNSTSFNFSLVSNNYAGISIGNESNISFSDIDNDGDKDMLIGRFDGRITYYKNDGSITNPNHVFVTDNYAGIKMLTNSVPASVDIDNDTDKDLFIGNIKGGLYYFENRDVIGIKPIGEIADDFMLEQNYPNPFNPKTTIQFSIPKSGNVNLQIYNSAGQLVQTLLNDNLIIGKYKIEWNASQFPSGIYFYKLVTDGFTETKKMVLIK